MGYITGPRERALFCQSLAPLIRGLEGRSIIVELKNEIVLHGTLQVVDCYMNLTMTNVRMVKADGTQVHFQFFFLQGKKSLRYIRIPDDINIKKVLKEQLDIVTGKKSREERKKAKEKRANWLRRKEAKNLAKSDPTDPDLDKGNRPHPLFSKRTSTSNPRQNQS